MTPQIKIAIFLIICIITAGIITTNSWLKRALNSGLTIIYIANLSLIHFFGALIYVFPWYQYGDPKIVLSGFRQATYGILAFAFGSLVLAPHFLRVFRLSRLNSTVKTTVPRLLSKLPKTYFLLGIISYFILTPIIGRLPTLNALVSTGIQLMVVGICLGCWQAWCEKDRKKLRNWLLIAFSFPFITIVNQGFLGYGTIMLITVLLFVARFYPPKGKVIIAGILLAYLGLTFYQGYMRDRVELRAVIWGGSSVANRVEALWLTIRDRKSTRLNSSHTDISRMPSSA